MNALTKPQGSLGQLETLAIEIAGMRGNPRPQIRAPHIIVCAADHGVAARGVSAYPAEVTTQMVLNFLRGGAAINVLARQIGAALTIADIGLATDPALLPADVAGPPRFRRLRVSQGTADMTRAPAMSALDTQAAIRAGQMLASEAAAAGADCILVGEMGIGNTTSASAITAVMCGRAPADVIGRGTGVDDAGLARKHGAVARALALHQPNPADPLAVLASLGGLEIAAMIGVIQQSAVHRLPVLLDGFISTAAALLAVGIAPATRHFLIASHASAEPGHTFALAQLGLEPLLRLQLRLGEASGAALALPLLRSACALLDEMATFGDAGVSDKTPN